MARLSCAILLTLASVLLTGCAEGEIPLPSTAKVSGTVNLDGKPMEGGEVRFGVAGQPAQKLAVTNGAFSGDVFIGSNVVEVVWDKETGPNPMDPSSMLKENVVDAKFSGPATPFKEEIAAAGASGLKYDVTTAKPAKK